MSYAAFVDLLGAWWGLASAIYFSAGVLRLRDESLKVISSSFYDAGEQVAVELAQQKVDFRYGALFLFLSFFSQLLIKLVPALQSMPIVENFWPAVFLSLAMAIVPLLVCIPLGRRNRIAAEEKARSFNKLESN